MAVAKHLVLLGLAAGCKSESRPALTPALMPPSAKPLVLGTSTEADVLAKLGPAKQPVSPGDRVREISKDKAFGGEGRVAYNEHSSIRIDEPGLGEFYLWAGPDGTPRLGRFEIRAPEGCAWLEANIGKLEGARNCPGNRKTGVSGDDGHYCLSLDDGRIVHAECRGSTITYWVGKKR